MESQILQIELISKDKIMVRTNQTIYIANLINPMKQIRMVTSEYNFLHNVGVSYSSQTFMYAKI